MKLLIANWFFVVGILLSLHHTALATAPYTEEFASNNANWFMDGGAAVPAMFQTSGGPDSSSYVSMDASAFSVPDDAPVLLFQARDEFNSSGHAFEGNWFGSGINEFSTYVRHAAPTPLAFFARFTRPTGGPGVAAEKATPVLPNIWTRLSFDLVESNINHETNNPTGELFVEGPPSLFNSVFTNVGHIQIGYSVPPGFGSNPSTYTFGLDKPSIAIVPEPAGVVAAFTACLIVLVWRLHDPATRELTIN